MDKFDIIDMSLIDRLGSENFNDIVMSLAKNNHKINYFYLFLNDHNPYNNFLLGIKNKDIKVIRLYELCLPYIQMEIRNNKINSILKT